MTLGQSPVPPRATHPSPLAFASGTFVAYLLVAVVSVYGFSYYEPGYGPHISFQIAILFYVLTTVLATFSYAIAAALTRRTAPPSRSFLLGTSSSLVTLSLVLLDRSAVGYHWITLFWWGFLVTIIASLATVFTSRHA